MRGIASMEKAVAPRPAISRTRSVFTSGWGGGAAAPGTSATRRSPAVFSLATPTFMPDERIRGPRAPRAPYRFGPCAAARPATVRLRGGTNGSGTAAPPRAPPAKSPPAGGPSAASPHVSPEPPVPCRRPCRPLRGRFGFFLSRAHDPRRLLLPTAPALPPAKESRSTAAKRPQVRPPFGGRFGSNVTRGRTRDIRRRSDGRGRGAEQRARAVVLRDAERRRSRGRAPALPRGRDVDGHGAGHPRGRGPRGPGRDHRRLPAAGPGHVRAGGPQGDARQRRRRGLLGRGRGDGAGPLPERAGPRQPLRLPAPGGGRRGQG